MSPNGVATSVGAICQQDDRLLLARWGRGPAGGAWHAPTVAVRAGETAAEALVRACDSLTGLSVLCGPFIGWSEDPAADPPSVTLYFEAVPLESDPTVAAPADGHVAEARFVDLWEVSELRLGDGLAEFLADSGIIDLVV